MISGAGPQDRNNSREKSRVLSFRSRFGPKKADTPFCKLTEAFSDTFPKAFSIRCRNTVSDGSRNVCPAAAIRFSCYPQGTRLTAGGSFPESYPNRIPDTLLTLSRRVAHRRIRSRKRSNVSPSATFTERFVPLSRYGSCAIPQSTRPPPGRKLSRKLCERYLGYGSYPFPDG